MSNNECKSTVTIPLDRYDDLIQAEKLLREVRNEGSFLCNFWLRSGGWKGYEIFPKDEAIRKLHDMIKPLSTENEEIRDELKIATFKLRDVGFELDTSPFGLKSRIKAILNR